MAETRRRFDQEFKEGTSARSERSGWVVGIFGSFSVGVSYLSARMRHRRALGSSRAASLSQVSRGGGC